MTDHVILNHGQVSWMTPELAPPLLTTTPHQREDVSTLDRFSTDGLPFPKGKNECCQSLRLAGILYNRLRHHLSPPPQCRNGTGGEGNILQPPAVVVSAATAHKTFGPTDLTSTYSMCTLRVIDGPSIEPRPSGLESDALTTRLPTVIN
ncbi:uncharacterized protein TNCV_495021 [Trichonephila clavipes]|nr:uncharacterized protein TNCV_495021 [Trichonephila clavipes]